MIITKTPSKNIQFLAKCGINDTVAENWISDLSVCMLSTQSHEQSILQMIDAKNARKILQIDDDLLFQAICAKHLEKFDNIELIHASSVNQAMTLMAQQSDIDMLLLDLALPDRDGFEFMKDLHTSGFTGKVAIISSQPQSVIQMAETMAKSLPLNVVVCLQKPMNAEKLEALDKAIFSD